MHVAFLFAVAIGCFAGALLNYLGELTSVVYVVLLMTLGVGVLAAWWYARQRVNAQPLAILLCGVAVFAVLPLNWFYNQGLDGPSLMLWLVVAGYAFGALLVKPWQRLILFTIFLVVPWALIYVDYRWPDWIAKYPTRRQRALDAAFTYAISVVLQLALIGGFFRRFQSEQQLIQEYAEQLRETARLDSLTGLLNHGAFYSVVDAQCRLPDGGDRPAVLILYDLDHFKQINDTHGHIYGDEALRFFARMIREVIADFGGTAGRCGGEEFGVLLPSAGRDGVARVDRSLRAACCERPLSHGAVRFSGGVALAPAKGVTHWMKQADKALYAAKTQGRDRTVFDH